MAYRLLCISNDQTLLSTRKLLFEREGYEVTSTLGFVAARESLVTGNFDVVFIGHSVPSRDMQELIHVSRQRSDVPVVAIRSSDDDWDLSIPGVRILELGQGPQVALDALRHAVQDR